MHPAFFLATFCLGIASAAPQVNQSLDEQWSQWKATQGKLYSMDEEGQKRTVWERNMQMIEQNNREHSQGKHSSQCEEFKQVLNDLKIQKHKKGKVFQAPLFAKIPSSVDWREKGYVTSVKDQGDCCSCRAFSATGALEGQMFQKTGKLVSLSEQNLADCSWTHGNKGCHGGLMDKESYTYHAKNESCKYKPENSVANVTAFWSVVNKEDGLMTTVATVGPVSAAVDASLNSFQLYKKGIYYDPKCSNKRLNHGVLVVGYGFEGEESDNKKYWTLGAKWGKHGYILMAKDRDNHCGIATMASFPIV
uniref:Procathepsin L n=1 Tax=Lynx canadensis TaxID=61383 RepID=A0A667H9U4_LYNCA